MKALNGVMRTFFSKLGWKIAENPKTFVLVPIVLSLCLACGFSQFKVENDFEYLFTPTTGESTEERSELLKYFPVNETGKFTPSRKATLGHFMRVIITTKDESNILTSQVWKEMVQFDQLVQNITIIDDDSGRKYKYTDLCSRWGDECHQNDILDMSSLMDKFEMGELKISYPIAYNPITYMAYTTGHYLSGVELLPDGFNIKSAKSVLLHYFVVSENSLEDRNRAIEWEKRVSQVLRKKQDRFKHLKIYFFTVSGVAQESDDNVFKVIPYLAYSFASTGAYIIMSLLMKDWVRSKPWLGIAGATAAAMGVIASIGLLLFCNLPFITLNMSLPFIMIGIGIDDAFVLTAAWRRTSTRDSVPKRMSETFVEASVSITITSLTDAFSFYVGILTPLPGIQIFSIYAGTTVLFIYLWQLFIFGGFLAISGYHEEENRHGLFFWKHAIPKSQAEKLPKWKQLLLVGGDDPSNKPVDLKGQNNNLQMAFFRDTFSSFLLNRMSQLFILVVYIAYIVLGTYGTINIDETFKVERLFRTDSFMYEYNIQEDKYLPEYAQRMELIITTPVDYSDPMIQTEINNLLTNLTSLDLISPEFTENWLTSFLSWAEIYQEFEPIDISTQEGFIDALSNYYLQDTMHFSVDVIFNQNKSQIIASRFILQIKGIVNKVDDLAIVVTQARDLVRAAENFDAHVNTYWNRYIDETIMIRELSIKLMVVASIVVLFVSMIFIPSLTVASCVFFTIISTQLGVIGFMSLWGVALDPLSLVSLIMCIGFSVDFAAHVSYAFVSCKDEDVDQRLRSSLHAVGLPVIQGAVSTLMGIFPLLFVPSYSFLIVFKIVSLVMIFSALHSLVVLPVILIFLKSRVLNLCSKSDNYDVTVIRTI